MATEIILPPSTTFEPLSINTNTASPTINPAPINLQPQIKKNPVKAKPKAKSTKKSIPATGATKKPKENKKLKGPKTPKVKADKTTNPKPKIHHKSEHPTWSKMMCDAIRALNERHGSSIPAIKKYILSNFKGVDEEHISTHMRRGMKSALASGSLTQIKGNGLSGSFKLGKGQIKTKKTKNPGPEQKKINKAKTTKKPTATPTGNASKKSTKPKQQAKKAKTPASVNVKPKAKKIKTASVTAPAKKQKATKKQTIKVKMSKTPKAAKIPKPKTHKKIIKK